MTHKIDTKTARKALLSRSSPYWKQIDPGFSIGYRKNKKSGTWFARRFVNDEYIMRRLGAADDNQEANGIDVLSFKQARQKGSAHEDTLETLEQPQHPALFTVSQAVEEYLEWYKANRKAYERTKLICEAHITPKLGNIPVALLTTPQLNKWLQCLATAPPRTPKGHPKPPFSIKRNTGKHTKGKGHPIFEYDALPYEEWTEDMKRKRKSTANRILTVLKAALNYAWRIDRVTDPQAWQKVKPFHGADAPKVKYLTEEEAGNLIQAASDDFRPMLQAALLTGCRYSELTRLRVRDLNRGQIYVAPGKTGKDRHVPLSKVGNKFFLTRANGKKPDDLLLTHSNGSAWARSHQTRPMQEACDKAGIERVGFHVLRHTYATLLLRADGSHGVSIRYVAALIGDSVATCEKHYGHVIQDDLRMEVARKLPSFGSA